MKVNRFRAISIVNDTESTSQQLGLTVSENGYIISIDNTPMWSKYKLLLDNVAHDAVTAFRKIQDVPQQYLKYVWKLNEVVNGKSFITKELFDEKTEKYINATITNLNYIICVSGYEEDLKQEGYTITVLSSNSVFLNTSNVDLLKLEKDDRTFYGLQYSEQTAIDDYIIVTHILSEQPTQAQISHTANTLKAIDTFKFDATLGRWNDYFTCSKCGKKTHWLDTEQKGLIEKLNAKDERYCGC